MTKWSLFNAFTRDRVNEACFQMCQASLWKQKSLPYSALFYLKIVSHYSEIRIYLPYHTHKEQSTYFFIKPIIVLCRPLVCLRSSMKNEKDVSFPWSSTYVCRDYVFHAFTEPGWKDTSIWKESQRSKKCVKVMLVSNKIFFLDSVESAGIL